MPPIRITNICPAATKPTKDATTRTDLMPSALAKPGRTISPTTNSSTAAQIAYSTRR